MVPFLASMVVSKWADKGLGSDILESSGSGRLKASWPLSVSAQDDEKLIQLPEQLADPHRRASADSVEALVSRYHILAHQRLFGAEELT